MDLRYRRLRSRDEDTECVFNFNMAHSSNRRTQLIMWLVVTLIAILIGFLIGWFSHKVPNCAPAIGVQDPAVSSRFLKSVKKENIKKYLRDMTQFTHTSGTSEELRLEQMIKKEWEGQGIKVVVGQAYNVLLSHPNVTDPSWAEILDGESRTVFRSSVTEANLTPEQVSSPVSPPHHAYAVAGDVTANLVYANNATEEDFIKLRDDYHINLTGKIIIARYGSSYRGDKVKFATKFGAAAILLYMDPKDYTSPGQHVFPNDKWLPGSAVQRGTILHGNGDPLTPNYPSTDSAYRLRDNETTMLPRIPSHPISYDDAFRFLSRLGGQEAPTEWQGGFNFSYHIGPDFTNTTWKARLRVTQINQRMPIRNLFGVIDGYVEPDRYVLLGNHRDAWTYGGIDPTSGTAAMMELSRAFMQLVNQGWRPRRTIVFCSWAAEEFGLIGSVEFVEDYVKVLMSRAVAYFNVDYIADGSDSLTVGAMPTLRDVIYSAAQMVQSPQDGPRNSVYDDWIKVFPSNDFPGTPTLDSLGDSSDHGGFIFTVGVPCYDAWYTTRENNGYPLYHTAYDGWELYSSITDPNFTVTLAMTQFWGATVLHLADSIVLPLNITHYAVVLKLFVSKLDESYGKLMRDQNISLAYLYSAADSFEKASIDFHTNMLSNIKKIGAYDVRRYNDQMMSVDRAFIDPDGLPLSPLYKHIIYAPSLFNSYSGTSFPGLTDLFHSIDTLSREGKDATELWVQLRKHLAIIIQCFRAATACIKPPTEFIYT